MSGSGIDRDGKGATVQEDADTPTRPINLSTARAIRRELGRVYTETRRGKLPPEVATKLVYILDKARAMVEASDLEARLDALEARADRLGG
jgi:hypothetical protein